MIGVICRKQEEEVVKEFFELFKTPWEFWTAGQAYEVIVSTEENTSKTFSKLLVIYSSNEVGWDKDNGAAFTGRKTGQVLNYGETEFPVYGEVGTLGGKGDPVLRLKDTNEVAGIVKYKKEQRVVRAGFDLFQEVHFLLSSGQPAKFAHIPTLEIHISMLRNWILDAGIPLVEIPPVPAGYDFMVCLTHDVDFAGIRNHKFDHTMFGFVYRALIGSVIGLIRRQASWSDLLRNWKAVFSLPFVYLGIVNDFWDQFERYLEIERNLPSTFFFLPFKNSPGMIAGNGTSKMRAGKYDLEELTAEMQTLKSRGCEIGLHGIDAWHDADKGREESERIASIGGTRDVGIRMHWLYFDSSSPENLEKAGFLYDSTFGYNDAIGYRAGSLQVFRFPGAKNLLELPLHIQDTALFYQGRMNLTQSKAMDLLQKLFQDAKQHGGVLTLNWHHRSIGPERFWERFYTRCLEEVKGNNVWFATGRDVVKWFRKRRAISFDEFEMTGNGIKLKLNGNGSHRGPDLLLRIHRSNQGFSDIPFSNYGVGGRFEIPISPKTELSSYH